VKKLTILLLPLIALSGCDKPSELKTENKVPASELNTFVQQVKKNLVFVEGGEFEMGDFGEKVYGMQIDPSQDSKPLHHVKLTSYSISKFKVSNLEYDFYLRYKGLKRTNVKNSLKSRYDEFNSTPETPAHMDWYEAEGYCSWLSKITKLPFNLPTEAQWEYASRSQGRFVLVPTNTGKADVEFKSGGNDRGVNIGTSYDREIYSKKMGTSLGASSSLPGDAFPPNAIGIYDMSANGFEWMKDWYDPEYYQHSPKNDPQGPDKPSYKDKNDGYQKVVRSSDRYNGIVGSVVDRSFRHPKITEKDYFLGDMTARCVVNLPNPVTH
jgi:formylglycine-generating enzyme required for sulfatase activity